jgi:hypothetical protein
MIIAKGLIILCCSSCYLKAQREQKIRNYELKIEQKKSLRL